MRHSAVWAKNNLRTNIPGSDPREFYVTINQTNMTKIILQAMTLLSIAVLIGLVVVFFPWFTIAAVNTLFNTGIQFTFYTWLATLWLTFIFVVRKSR